MARNTTTTNTINWDHIHKFTGKYLSTGVATNYYTSTFSTNATYKYMVHYMEESHEAEAWLQGILEEGRKLHGK